MQIDAVAGSESRGDRVTRRRERQRQLVLAALLVLWVPLLVRAVIGHLWLEYPFGVDLEIPLRAAERWSTGGQPYLASAFSSPPGPTQPFLYPPYVLPFVTALLSLPRDLLKVVWSAFMLVAAVFAVRRLGVRPALWPLVIAWPPFSEGIYGGNIQILLFALFTYVFWVKRADGSAEGREVSPAKGGLPVGLAATVIGAIKVSQPHTWIRFATQRPVVAVAGAVVVGAIAAATLVVTGLPIWGDWLAQLGRATSNDWELGGIAISRFFPVVGLLMSIAAVLALPFVPRATAGEWVGLLAVVGATSLHPFGLLFLLPAMLRIRAEIALVAAIFVTTYSFPGQWAGILVVAVAFAAAQLAPERYRSLVSGRGEALRPSAA